MEDKWMLMALVLGLSIYLQITWMVMLIGIAAAILLVGSLPSTHAPPARAVSSGKEEEILTPVIVQDVGDSPYLYPEKFDLKVIPKWGGPFSFYEEAGAGMGSMFKVASNLMHGKKIKGWK